MSTQQSNKQSDEQSKLTIDIYHNPRCSKSRQTLALLEAEVGSGTGGAVINQILYLVTPPTASELEEVCRKLGLQPSEIIRHKEAKFTELGLSLDDDRSPTEWCDIISANPILLERPIVVVGDKAAIGRPPESVLTIL